MINSRYFQRLRYIKQLGFLEYVYPGASHNRFQHSLGVCQCVTDMYHAVVRNCPSFYREGDLELLRMIALVHDLGHSPGSHAGEELSTITHEERLLGILEYESKNVIMPNSYGIPSWELVYQVYNGEGTTYLSDSRLITLHSFLDSFTDADKLDYLERDAINCGVRYGQFDRIGLVANLTIERDSNGMEVLALKRDGIQALENFILARYYMFNIYTDPIERLYRHLFCEFMKGYLPNGLYPEEVTKFLAMDDTKIVHKLKFLRDCPYTLVLDTEYSGELKDKVLSKFGSLVLCDVVRKGIFRRDTEDSTVYISDPLNNRIVPCTEVSPILRGVEYENIHKLRIYSKAGVEKEIGDEVMKIARGLI